MTVLLVERLPGKIRGEITRWMLNVSEGVYVGRLSPTMRDGLWERVLRGARPRSAAVLVYTANTDQGFAVRIHGTPRYKVVDFEGLALVEMAQ